MTANSSMADTSLQAFQQKKEDGSLKGDRKQVYELIKQHGPITCEQVAEKMGKYPHQISGRFSELREDKDVIEITGIEDGHRQYQVKN